MAKIDNRKTSLDVRLKNINAEIAEWEANSLDYSQRLAAYQKLQSQLDLTRQNFTRLSQSLESIDLNQNIQQEMVNVLELASPSWEMKADLGKDMIKGVVTGVFAALAI